MPLSWFDSEVIILRAPLVEDEYGTPGTERDWDAAVQTFYEGCDLQPVSPSEYDQGREAITVRWRLFGPSDLDVLGSDRAVHDGSEYEVVGDGQTWSSPTGAVSNTQALLERVRG